MCSTRRRCRRAIFDAELGISACSMRRRRLTAAVAAMAAMPPPRLFLLTRNAQPVGEGDRANPAHAVLWGLGRTLALEHPEIWGGHHRCRRVGARWAGRPICAGRGSRRRWRGSGRLSGRCAPCPAPAKGLTRPSTSPVELDKDSSHLVIGATGNIGPHLIRQLADMGAATIVAVSRNPGSRLDELARLPVGERNDVGDGGRRCGG